MCGPRCAIMASGFLSGKRCCAISNRSQYCAVFSEGHASVGEGLGVVEEREMPVLDRWKRVGHSGDRVDRRAPAATHGSNDVRCVASHVPSAQSCFECSLDHRCAVTVFRLLYSAPLVHQHAHLATFPAFGLIPLRLPPRSVTECPSRSRRRARSSPPRPLTTR